MPDFKDFPTPGFQYIVKRDDSLNDVETMAYGAPTGTLDALHPFLAGRNKNEFTGRPFLYTGDVLTIPLFAELATIKTEQEVKQISGKRKDEITIVLDNKEIAFTTARITRTMDTAADGWTCNFAWTPGLDKELDNLILPFSYTKAQIYIGNELIINGYLYKTIPSLSKDGLTVTLEGFSFAADVIDSTMPAPYEEEMITLEDRTNNLIRGMGIKAVFNVDEDSQFDRVTGEITDTIFGHLSELAFQRGILISSTPEGNLLFTKADTKSASVGTLETGTENVLFAGASFDGRKLFNQVTAIGESPGEPTNQASIEDSNIPKSRFTTFKADNTTAGDIEQAARWKQSKQYAEADNSFPGHRIL